MLQKLQRAQEGAVNTEHAKLSSAFPGLGGFVCTVCEGVIVAQVGRPKQGLIPMTQVMLAVK